HAWDTDFVERVLDDISEYPAETAHLSIVLTTLWESRGGDSDLKNYELLGGVPGILKDYLWKTVDAMTQHDLVRSVLKAFVSPERRKSQVTIEDLAAELTKKDTPIKREELTSICDRLIQLRLLRQVPVGASEAYELSHDLLAEAIAETVNKE